MTTNEYAGKVAELIDARPRRIDLDKLLYEITVRAKIAESRRDQQEGRWMTTDQMRAELWKKISSKLSGQSGQKKISTKSSTRFQKTRQ